MTGFWSTCLLLAVLSTGVCAVPGWLLNWGDRPARYGWRLAAALSWALAMFALLPTARSWSLSWWLAVVAFWASWGWVATSWKRWETARRKAGTR